MSRRYEETVTLELGETADEHDLPVRAHVAISPCSRGWTAELDGELEVLLNGSWVSADAAEVSAATVDRAEEALCNLALEDGPDGPDEDDYRSEEY